MAGVVVLIINDIPMFGLMAGIFVLVIDDIPNICAGVVVLAVGDSKLVTEMIHFGLEVGEHLKRNYMISVGRHTMDNYQSPWTSWLGKRPTCWELACSWNLRGLGNWNDYVTASVVGWFLPLYIFEHLNVCSMFVGLLHFVWISNKMMHYANHTISGALPPAMNTNGFPKCPTSPPHRHMWHVHLPYMVNSHDLGQCAIALSHTHKCTAHICKHSNLLTNLNQP